MKKDLLQKGQIIWTICNVEWSSPPGIHLDGAEEIVEVRVLNTDLCYVQTLKDPPRRWFIVSDNVFFTLEDAILEYLKHY